MSIVNEERNGLDLHEEASVESQKRSKLLYTREFLLSLSDLDVCKRLPSGFDPSFLSELEDTSQDRFRAFGGLSSQSYKRTEYGSSPPTRGDTSNFSSGIQGRWDNRSSVRSDRDNDSQYDKESDTGRRYANQSRRPSQDPEHDGLLGSGSFPRPSGFAVGSSASKFQEPSKTNKPYQPPRPYKAAPHSRRETNDSFNEETFGSSGCTTEDREEEERKRRASFELLRKEHQKAFQERQKLNPGKGVGDFDFSSLMGDSRDEKRSQNRSTELDGPAVSNNPHKAASSSAPVSRPLVPPGFSSAAAEKSNGTKVVTNSQLEVVNDPEGSLLHNKGNNLFIGASHNQEQIQPVEPLNASEQEIDNFSINVPVNSSKGQKSLELPSTMDASSKLIGKDTQFCRSTELLEVLETQKNGGVTDLSPEDVMKGKFIGGSGPTGSTSILEKLFGNALVLNGGDSSSSVEQHDPKMEEVWISSDVQSSKFAQWFLEEGKNPVDDVSSGGPNSLLSLFAPGEKGLSHPSDDRTAKHILPDLSVRNGELVDKHRISSSVLTTVKDSELTRNKVEPVASVLTCEDLEQSILYGITGSSSSLSANEHCRNVVDQKTLQQKARVDDHASHHILSLLQKGKSLNDAFPSAILGAKSVDNVKDMEEPSSEPRGISILSDTEHSATSGKALTLETLFGTAFMKELQPVGVPTASQPAKAGIAKVDIPESHGPCPESYGGLLRSTLGMTSLGLGSGVPPSNEHHLTKSDRIEDRFIAFSSSNKVDSSQIRTELVSRIGGLDACADGIGFTKEGSLLAVSDPLNSPDLVHARNLSNKIEVMATQEMAVDITEKLAALSSSFRDERSLVGGQEGPPFGRSPYEMRKQEVQYQNHRVHPSPHQLNHSQISNAGSMFHPLDSHSPNINPQMRFMSPENVIHRDAPSSQYHGNMLPSPFHHPNGSSTVTGFDPSPQNALLQQMHMTGNFPHQSHGFPRGAPAAPHLNNQMPGFIPHANPMQSFPFGQRQTNLGAALIPPHAAGLDSGTNRPDALQKLTEMELGSKPEQVHPLGAVGHGQSVGFRYR